MFRVANSGQARYFISRIFRQNKNDRKNFPPKKRENGEFSTIIFFELFPKINFKSYS